MSRPPEPPGDGPSAPRRPARSRGGHGHGDGHADLGPAPADGSGAPDPDASGEPAADLDPAAAAARRRAAHAAASRRARRYGRGGGRDRRESAAWRWTKRVGLGIAALAVLVTLLPGETPGVLPPPPVPAEATPEETVAAVRAAEDLIDGIRESAAKEVIWAGDPGAVTPLSIVYVHGFSASKAELRPVPDRVARALGANLFYTRLAGHGRDGAALGRARASHWMLDMAEALAVGKAIGERTLVIGTSMGGALAALAAVEPAGQAGVAGYVLVSPAFRLSAPGAGLLRLPFARTFAPWILGPERAWEPLNDAHAAGWTTAYPSEALVPLAAVAAAAELTDYRTAAAPALFVISDSDRIVSPEAARRIARDWGAGATVEVLDPGPNGDPDAHVLAGDALGAETTAAMIDAILAWVARRVADTPDPSPAPSANEAPRPPAE